MRHLFALLPACPALRRARALVLGLLLLAGSASARDLESELMKAAEGLQKIQATSQKLLLNGEFDDANTVLISAFPKEKRTPIQALLLGNALYRIDPKLSYGLHKEAAEKMPDEPQALLEWAMEQHRAGEYAGALASYDAYSKAQPDMAPVHGLAADCLLRLGKTKEAAARWAQSEKASTGTLETLETLVCEVYADATFDRRRAKLRLQAQAGDVDAAVQLVVTDVSYEPDWWNRVPHRAYLQSDRELLHKLPANPRIEAAKCVADCFLPEAPEAKKIRGLLTKHGLLIDKANTLPADDALAALLFRITTDVEMEKPILTKAQVQKQFTKTLVERGLRDKNAELLNVAAYVNVGKPGMLDLELKSWEATADPRFAGGYLAERMIQKTLKADDPQLARALVQFPENSEILALQSALLPKPDAAWYARAIKAEYRHFSMGALSARPSARALRFYFAKLAELTK